MLRVAIEPRYSDAERAGGVQRVIDFHRQCLPHYDIEIVDRVEDAQVFIGHAGSWTDRADIPRVAYCHGMYWSDAMYTWPKWAPLRNADIARTFLEADLVITPSEWVADIIRRDMFQPVEVFPNGIPRALIDAPIRGGASSYVYWNKARVDAVCELESLNALAQLHSDREFVITVPPTRKRPNIRSVGVVPYAESIRLMQEAGVYLATTREVFGVSVMEALALGIPTLGYQWGGQREQLRHAGGVWSYEGILVPPGNVGALGEGLKQLSDLALWKHMSEAAKERALDYDWEPICERLATRLHRLWQEWDGHLPAGRPEISVVIPNYNLGRYLMGAVESLVRQKDAPPFEVIIVDDASTDDSYATATKLVEKVERGGGIRAKVIRHERNRYLAEALNTGIREARGRWIINLDPDNELPPLTLAKLYEATRRHPELDVLYGGIRVIRDDGTPEPSVGSPDGIPNPVWPPARFDFEQQMRHQNQVHSSAMFRRRMWERSGGYRQCVTEASPSPAEDSGSGSRRVRLNSDAEFWTRTAALGFRFGKIVTEPTLTYRRREGQMSATVQEWDWTQTVPHIPSLGAPLSAGRVLTHEPIAVTIIVEDAEGAGALVESLWPQTFPYWEVYVVPDPQRGDNLSKAQASSPRSAVAYPVYTKRAGHVDEALEMAAGKWKIVFPAGPTVRVFQVDALERLSTLGLTPGVYDGDNSILEDLLVGCGSCGGGMRPSARSFNPIAPRVRPTGRERRGEVLAPPSVEPTAGVSGATTKVEFLGSGVKRVPVPGRVFAGTRERFQYIFSDFAGHGAVRVYDEDLALFRGNKNLYRITDERYDADGQRVATEASAPAEVPA